LTAFTAIYDFSVKKRELRLFFISYNNAAKEHATLLPADKYTQQINSKLTKNKIGLKNLSALWPSFSVKRGQKRPENFVSEKHVVFLLDLGFCDQFSIQIPFKINSIQDNSNKVFYTCNTYNNFKKKI
jgi:hypothetical protein